MKTSAPSEITVAQLFEAYYDCRRNKRTTDSALAFEIDLEANLLALLDELRAGTWTPAPATVFAITRPKPREVWAAAFRDRIVHHLVYRAIAPLFEPAFIVDSCACIRGRGTLYAARRLTRHLRSATRNWTAPAFVLKADIANFFGSIRHQDLFAMLARRIGDPTMLDLCRKLVFQDVRQGAIRRGIARHLALVPRHKSLFHASSGVDSYDRAEVRSKAMPTGGIVGIMDVADCVTEWPGDWFFGPYGFVVRNARPLPFVACRGKLGFFRMDEAVMAALRRAVDQMEG